VRAAGEWYLAGTEPGAAGPPRAAPGPRDARILAPEDGLVLALDPDIPDTRERLLLEATPGSEGLALHLDGRPLGPAGAARLWLPERGRHSLALVGDGGAVLDRVAFEVR
jgi:penicillin-binding protein 1C